MHEETEKEFDKKLNTYFEDFPPVSVSEVEYMYRFKLMAKSFVTTHFIDKRTLKEELEKIMKKEAQIPIPQIRGDSYRMGYNQALQYIKDKLL